MSNEKGQHFKLSFVHNLTQNTETKDPSQLATIIQYNNAIATF